MEKDLLTEIQEDYKKPHRKPRVKKEKKVKRSFISRILSGLFVLVIIATGVVYAGELYNDWRAEHEWQFPTKWVGLVREIERNEISVAYAETVQPLNDMQILEQYHLSPVLKTIYFLESTSGKNDSCKDNGKFNGFGYRQNSFENKCYDSFEQVAEKVNEWFEERLAMNGNDLVEAVCLYNRGIQGLQVCDYSINFMSVITKNF